MSEKPDLSSNHARRVARELAKYRVPDSRRGAIELAITIVPLIVIWLVMQRTLDTNYALTLALALPAAGFLLRLFLIQHDCGHGAFFRSRRANDYVGKCIGVLTLTPYGFWRRAHAMHHAGTGNLDRRGLGDVDTLTVAEFSGLPRSAKLRYWLYRHPVTVFGLGPAYLFLFRHRLPLGLARHGWGPWVSTMGTNIAIAAMCSILILLVGLRTFLMIQLPITLLAASAGVWLFYVQHQFERTSWRRSEEWTFHEAALHGSSYLAMPPTLRWFTANIGMHHMHHLCSTVPFYRLPAAMKAMPELGAINRMSMRESLRGINLVLWDERSARLVSFSEVRTVAGKRSGLLRSLQGTSRICNSAQIGPCS